MNFSPAYVIRDVTDPWKMRELEEVQVAAWGYTDRELLPATMFRISAAMGGIVLGAYPADDPQGLPVGLAYGFPAFVKGELWHHSHFLATHPAWRGQSGQGSGLAVALKLAQRERALQQGLTRMTWTVDPLVARNARLNLGKLGARASSYHPDWYALGDTPQTAFPADRLMMEWDLTQPHSPRPAPRPTGEVVLRAAEGGVPVRYAAPADAPTLLVEVPTVDLFADLKLVWRMALRQALVGALAEGYVVTDLARDGQHAYYVLTRPVA